MSKPLFIDVITTKRDDPNTILSNRRVNINRVETRNWLSRHIVATALNNMAVHTAKSAV